MTPAAMEFAELGSTGIRVSRVALGCWPIAGMTSLDVTDADSLATVRAALELGINFFDTASCYGAAGESEKLLSRALAGCRDQVVIATKGGIHWGPHGEQVLDARPATLKRQCDESLRRLGTDHVELYYLHAPDPRTPVAESAGALAELMAAGKTHSVGVSNCSVAQMEAFAAVCPITAVQPPFNLLQRQIEEDLLPWCRARGVSVHVYWPLMKGLLAGKLPRDHVFPPGDSRAKYPMFQGDEWQKNQDFVDCLRAIAAQSGHSVAQLAVRWVLEQPGITTALCGAKRPDQIRETAGAASWQLTPQQQQELDEALRLRGTPLTRPPV